MNQPNPFILVKGGLALLLVSLMAGALPGPAWVRYGAMGACILLGVMAIGLGVSRAFEKKPERTRFVSKKKKAPPK